MRKIRGPTYYINISLNSMYDVIPVTVQLLVRLYGKANKELPKY